MIKQMPQKLNVPENQSRVVDLEVSDPDGLPIGMVIVRLEGQPDRDLRDINGVKILINRGR